MGMTRWARDGWSRRRFLRAVCGGCAAVGAGLVPMNSVAGAPFRKAIPASGEMLPMET
ncbi:MAG: twin-arginine translocation signal domain-containing protein [Thioalkalivibrio sp.]|nr:MAG: twin-arginine translocation signal domain-containing protein [Thioalkalivibrio sp.]